MDVRRLDEMQAQGRSIFDTDLAVAYYARVSTDKDEQINSLSNQKRYFEDCIAENPHWTFAGGYVDEGISGTEEFKQRNEVCNEQLAALEERRNSLQNAEQTLAERIRRVENLRRTIEEQWQANCGFSREMSKALVNRIVVDADENKTCISLDVFLTAGRESCTDPVLPAASQASDAPLKMTFPRPRSGHQGGYEVTYCVRWHLD